MTKKAIANSKKKTLKPIDLLYEDSYMTRRQTQQHHDKFCWRIGFGVIAVLTGFFIWGLIEII